MIICADDFGLTQDIEHATLELAEQGRLSAVSCMVAVPQASPARCLPLQTLAARLDLGLHLVLTDTAPLSPPDSAPSLCGAPGRFWSFGELLRRTAMGCVDGDEVGREIAVQYERFCAWFGRPPDFVDSHLHVHQFPGVRDALVRFLTSRPAAQRPYVRNTRMPTAKLLRQGVSFWKCWTIGICGRRMWQAAYRAELATNRGFAGIYDYRNPSAYPRHLSRFLACMESPTGILMVHPGLVEPWRRAEYEALRSAPLPAGVPTRFPRPQ